MLAPSWNDVKIELESEKRLEMLSDFDALDASFFFLKLC